MTTLSPGLAGRCADLRRQLASYRDSCRRDPLDLRADAVSHWSVGQQLEHMSLVDRRLLGAMKKKLDDPGSIPDGRGVTLLGRVVLWTGWIPRGRGKAPQECLPQAIDPAALEAAWREIERAFAELEPRFGELEAAKATLPHPVFGYLDLGQWLRFMAVHHHHHWKIIRDIRRACGQT